MIDDWCPNAACHRLALHSMCAAVPCGWGERLLEICVCTILNNQRAPHWFSSGFWLSSGLKFSSAAAILRFTPSNFARFTALFLNSARYCSGVSSAHCAGVMSSNACRGWSCAMVVGCAKRRFHGQASAQRSQP